MSSHGIIIISQLMPSETPMYRQLKEKKLTQPSENTSLHTALQNYAKNIPLIIHTADEDEWSAICESMQGPKLENVEENVSKQNQPLCFALNADTNLVMGEFGGYSAALIETDDECSELEETLVCLTSAKCIISIGTVIAFNRKNHKLCDVVVSDCIDGILKVDRSDATKTIKFGQHDTRFTPVSRTLTSIFKQDNTLSWEGFECTKQRGRKSKVYRGTIMSMPYDVFWRCCKDKVLELPSNESTYIGVESNGAPILQIINRMEDGRKIDVILIEGVRCYVNDYRHDKNIWKWQTTACMAATSYAKYKLEHSSESKKYFSGQLYIMEFPLQFSYNSFWYMGFYYKCIL